MSDHYEQRPLFTLVEGGGWTAGMNYWVYGDQVDTVIDTYRNRNPQREIERLAGFLATQPLTRIYT